MSFPDILAVDLPTIVVLIVLWLLDYFKLRGIEKKLGGGQNR